MTAVAALLAQAPAATTVTSDVAAAAPPGTTRSHLADGWVITWRHGGLPPGHRAAVDAELAGQPIPAVVARRFGPAEPATFWPRWTAVEVACKLHDVGLLAWLSRYGLWFPPALPIRTARAGGLVLTWGVYAPAADLVGRQLHQRQTLLAHHREVVP